MSAIKGTKVIIYKGGKISAQLVSESSVNANLKQSGLGFSQIENILSRIKSEKEEGIDSLVYI